MLEVRLGVWSTGGGVFAAQRRRWPNGVRQASILHLWWGAPV